MKSKKYAFVQQESCVACGECAFVCPKGAAKVIAGCYASVDTDSCIGCGLCNRNCPVGCISMVER